MLQCEPFHIEVKGGVEQTLGSRLVAGSSEGQTKVGSGRGVAVLVSSMAGQRWVAVKGEP